MTRSTIATSARRHGRRLGLLSCLAVVLAGCRDDRVTRSATDPTCEHGVQVTVGPGATPLIRWTPACAMSDLAVNHEAVGEAAWSVYMPANATPRNGIRPPVRYGQLPPGATQTAPAAPLTPGRYSVWLSRHADSEPPGSELLPIVVAAAPFTR